MALRKLAFFGTIFFSCCLHGFAQSALEQDWLEYRYPRFKVAHIASAGIQSIEIKILAKPSSRTIRDNGKRIVYQFDLEGRLISWTKIFPIQSGGLDTTRIEFTYRDNTLVNQLEFTGNYSKKTEWKDLDSNTRCQVVSAKRGNLDWQILSTDKLQTLKTKSGEVIRVSGIESLPYESTVTEIRPDGQMTSRCVWNGERVVSEEVWTEKTGTASYSYRNSNSTRNIKVSSTGKDGEWCVNDKCRKWAQIWYNNQLPKGWIFMDIQTQDMEIWEFSYVYFPKP